MPHVDWGAAQAWIASLEPDPSGHEARRRAVAAVWLDELRDALEIDHRRWRHARVEGLGPLEGGMAERVARAADRAAAMVGDALRPLRGGRVLPPIAVIALGRTEDYYTFTSHYYPEEGRWGTSGGVYINDGSECFPMIVLPVQVRHSVEETIAHEMTHHALRGMELPEGIEEGLTQMMEERMTGQTAFRLDHEMLARHRERWPQIGLDRFWSGEAFASAEDDEQELAYHLAQVIVRGLLTERPRQFFAFARACANCGPDAAAVEHLGESLSDMAGRWVGAAGEL